MKSVLLCLVTLFFVTAEEVIKVTYAPDGVGVRGASNALEFSPYAMVVTTQRGDLNEIKKVEYYDDKSVILQRGAGSPIAVREGFIGFEPAGGDLSLTLPGTLELTVSLCSPDGKSVALLFCGETTESRLPLHILDRGLASGSYSLVVATNDALFVRSLALR